MAENMILFSTLCDQNENGEILSENQDILDENEVETAFEANQGDDLVQDYGESESTESRIGDTEETMESGKNGAIDDNVVIASNPEVNTNEPVLNGPGTGTTGHIDDYDVEAGNLEVAETTKDGRTVGNDDDESNQAADEAAPKRVTHSRKNRNIKSVITTLKNKIENIQTKNGGSPNYLLILEDNFSDVSATGPKTKTNRKLIVTAEGNLREAFKHKTIGYDPETMIVMKKGKNLEQDFSFLEEYIKDRTSPIALNQAIQNPAGCSTPPNPSLVQLLQTLVRDDSLGSKKKRKRSKKKPRKSKVFDSSTDDSTDDSDSDSSEEPIRKRRKAKRSKKGKKQKTSHEVRHNRYNVESDESESDSVSDALIDLLENTDEEDADPNHGTIQKPKTSKTKPKKSAPRQPKERKEKNDILKIKAKKVLTPGSFPGQKKAKVAANVSKSKVTQKVPPTIEPAESLITDEPEISATNKNVAGESLCDKADELSTMPPNLKVTSWLQTQQLPSVKSSEKVPTNSSKTNQVKTTQNTSKPVPKVSKPIPKVAKPMPKKPMPRSTKPIPKTSAAKPFSKVSQMAQPAPPKVANKENVPNKPNEPGPSGQFRSGRGSILLEESARNAKTHDKPHKPVSKRLFISPEDIEKHLDMDKTPTRKK